MCKLTQHRSVMAMLISFCLFNIVSPGSGQTWVQTGALSNSWLCVGSSADGSVLAAGGPQGLFISTNSGGDWSQANLPTNKSYSGVALSADGSRVAATYQNGGMYYSTDFGATWATNNTVFPLQFSGYAHPIASSADGTKLAISCKMIYTSTDGGATWTSNNISGPRYAAIASSADGNKLAVASLSANAIYLSTNAGLTWMTNTVTNAAFQDIACSADGTHLISAGGVQVPDGLYTSLDSGMTWVSNAFPREAWRTVASSADGAILAAAGLPSPVVFWTNGVWTTNALPVTNQSFSCMASSADGGQLVGAVEPGGIYVLRTVRPPLLNLAATGSDLLLDWLVPSTNYVLQQSPDLISWANITNPPSLNLTNLHYQLMLSPTNESTFYRLASP